MTTSGYATLLELSQKMLELAKAQEWESLAQIQDQRAVLIVGMAPRSFALSPAELASTAKSIREVQELDREILEYVVPWREDVAKLLTRLAPSQ